MPAWDLEKGVGGGPPREQKYRTLCVVARQSHPVAAHQAWILQQGTASKQTHTQHRQIVVAMADQSGWWRERWRTTKSSWMLCVVDHLSHRVAVHRTGYSNGTATQVV